MNLKSKNGLLLLENEFFNPRDIFTCGQAFHWVEEDDGSFTVINKGRILNLKLKDEITIIQGSSLKEFEDYWWHYFDLNKEYSVLRESLPEHYFLKNAMDFGKGIRILNQDIFETIISFIISAMNNIKRIRRTIFSLSELYGEKVDTFKGRDWYSFPEPEILKDIPAEILREKSGVGFRDVRIVEASKRIYEKEFSLNQEGKSRLEVKRELMTFSGIGPKVADCILLFSYDFMETFPVDVWIQRIMEKEFGYKNLKPTEIEKIGREYFGENAGLAQQYIFYYGREQK